MAAPPNKTLHNLDGVWVMSSLSDPISPILTLQGLSWIKRKAFLFATLTLTVSTSTLPPPLSHTKIEISQHITGGIRNQEIRTLDWEFGERDDDTWGVMKGRTRWVKREDGVGDEEGDGFWGGLDEWLREGWLVEDDEDDEVERDGAKGKRKGEDHVYTIAMSEKNGWSVEQVWGFAMVTKGAKEERYYVRRLIARKGEEVVRTRLVYDWIRE